MIQHTSTAERTKEVEEPAGDSKPASTKFDAEKFTREWFEKHAPNEI